MPEKLNFHFQGGLADAHQMNFYEAARFQYAAARLVVKLAQFRKSGRFVGNIHHSSNVDIRLDSQIDGSYNIDITSPDQETAEEQFIKISIADLIAFVSERIIEKIDSNAIKGISLSDGAAKTFVARDDGDHDLTLSTLIEAAMTDKQLTASLPAQVQDLVRRRVAEAYRERRLVENQTAIQLIDFSRSQKLVAMSAPLYREMATALRTSADTLEVRAASKGAPQPVLFLNQQMAREIETAIVDDEITSILGDITQFNKENGWGKFKIENGLRVLSFSIPSDILPTIRQKLINHMQQDQVYLQTYYVRDRSREVTRLIVVGVLPTPSS